MIAVNRLKMSGELNLENQFTDGFLFFRKMNECAERFDLIWFIRLLRLNCTPLQWVNRFRIDAVYVDGAPPKNWWGELWAYACTRTVRVHSLEQNTSHSNNEQLVPRGQLVRSCRLQTLGFCVCLRESGIALTAVHSVFDEKQRCWLHQIRIRSERRQSECCSSESGQDTSLGLSWPDLLGPGLWPVLSCPALAWPGQDRTGLQAGTHANACSRTPNYFSHTVLLFCSVLCCTVLYSTVILVLCCAVLYACACAQQYSAVYTTSIL